MGPLFSNLVPEPFYLLELVQVVIFLDEDLVKKFVFKAFEEMLVFYEVRKNTTREWIAVHHRFVFCKKRDYIYIG